MQVKPFKAFRFDADVVGDVGGCVAPPYDVIDAELQNQLYLKSKYNIVRIIRGKSTASDNNGNNHYTRAATFFNNWMEQGALKQDLTEAIYAYVQDFEMLSIQFQRLSFIALAKLEEFGKVVKPHEQILNEPMVDRLNLKKATAADFGSALMLYEDQQKIADKIIRQSAAQEPLIDIFDEQNVRHRLFSITSKQDIEQIVDMMSDKSCIIADGHHRYTTGLNYSKETNNPEAKYQMLAFANISQEGLVALATHRLVCNIENFSMEKLIVGLRENFQVMEFGFDSAQSKTNTKQKMLAQMKAEYKEDNNAFGIYGANNTFYVAVLKDKNIMDMYVPNKSQVWKELDVSILHKLILEKLLKINEENLKEGKYLQYVKDTPNAIDHSISQVDKGEKQAAFLMNPIKIQQLKMVTDSGERMPQKSTYFYPKIYAGLTIHKL